MAPVTHQESAVAEAENKHIVFGIYKRNGGVYIEIVETVKAKTLQKIIIGKVSFDSTVYTEGFRSYNSKVHTRNYFHALMRFDPIADCFGFAVGQQINRSF